MGHKMWVIQKKAVPDEMLDSVQGLQVSFRSNNMFNIYKQIDGI